jgi:hypothetical protein
MHGKGPPRFAWPEKVGGLVLDEFVAGAAFAGSPDAEIARAIGCGESTLKRRFGPVLVTQRALRKVSIRQWQMAAARKGVPALLIWLGKQDLGQRDVVDLTPEDLEKLPTDVLDRIARGDAPTLALVQGKADVRSGRRVS